MCTIGYCPKLVLWNNANIALTSQILCHNDSCKAIVTATKFFFTSKGTLNDVFKLFLFSFLKVGWQFREDIADVFFHIMEWLSW